jgi:putative peptidoglycan lipid II flippase
MLVAHLFGAGLAADAFYAAFRIPNLLRRLLGEGSLSASFIPVLSEYLHTKSKEETQELINVVFTTLLIVLTVLTVLGMIFSRQIVGIIAYGFANDPEKLQLTTDLTRLMFPFVLFICLAALGLGILNTLSSFFMPAIAPASLSVSEIGFILALAPMMAPGNQIKGLAIAVIIGGIGQFAVQLPQMLRLGWRFAFRFDLHHPGLRRIGLLMLPSMIGLSVDQINAFVDTICASFLQQGSITALYYSNRVMQLPLAIFGLAMASVALPTMSKAAAQKNMDEVKGIMNYSIRLIIFILVPAAVGLMIIGLPIIRVLFERGNFDIHASMLTNSALVFYAVGLPAFAIVKVLASAFFSLQQNQVPVKVGVVAMLLNAVLNVVLMQFLGVGGLALATSIASYFNAVALAVILRKKIGVLGMRRIAVTVLQTAGAALLMGATCYVIAYHLLAAYPAAGMVTAIIAGIGVYFGAAQLIGIEERKPLLSVVLKEKPALNE